MELDINLEDYYQEIVNKIEKGDQEKMKKHIWKWAIAPICLIISISGILFLNNQENRKSILKNMKYVDKKIM